MENGTKLRLLYLYQHLIQNTDQGHPMTGIQLTKMLQEQYEMSVSRNTIANDLLMLHESGLQIEVVRSSQNKYFYSGNLFTMPEMRLLVDAVSSSKFITEQESEELIDKLLKLVPLCDAGKLRRHIYVSDRIKSDNERGYDIVDTINEAIDSEMKLSFFYTDYDMNKQHCRMNDGKPYTVSPYTFMWDGDYYYLRGYCDEREAMRTFRLDRIEKQPEILCESAIPKPEEYSVSEYNKAVFRMFDTDEQTEVKLLCKASVMKALIDQFGMNVDTDPVDEEHFTAKVSVCASPTFYRWIFGFGGGIRILEPESVKEAYHKRLAEAMKLS